MNDTLKKKIAIKSRDKYFKFFNSTIDAEFTINKSLNINKKYYWKINNLKRIINITIYTFFCIKKTLIYS